MQHYTGKHTVRASCGSTCTFLVLVLVLPCSSSLCNAMYRQACQSASQRDSQAAKTTRARTAARGLWIAPYASLDLLWNLHLNWRRPPPVRVMFPHFPGGNRRFDTSREPKASGCGRAMASQHPATYGGCRPPTRQRRHSACWSSV
jgi:hypothetical protein